MAQKKTEQAADETPAANDAAPADQDAQPQEPADGPKAAVEPGAEAIAAGEQAPAERAAELVEEIASLKDQVLRAVAEAENVRKRSRKQLEDMAKYASTDFAKDMLGVGDNLRRALDSVPEDALEKDEHLKNLAKGVELTEKGLITVIERHGIKQINPLGEKFDPNLHQAMFHVEDANQPAGTVAQVVQSGYMIHDRLLRPAMVGVVKARDGEAASGETPEETPAEPSAPPRGETAQAGPDAE